MDNKVMCRICGHKLSAGEVRCPKCGAVYPQSHTDQFDFYGRLYNDKPTCISYLRRERIYETIVNKILHISKDKGAMAMLDIGASVGISIILLKQYGEARGIELDIPELREWHKFLGIDSAMIYMDKNDNIGNFYARLAKELNEKIDFIFLIDTLRCIPLFTLIDIVSRCLKENGIIIIKEINPDNRKIFEHRISGQHGDLVMYSPKTVNYLARRNKLNVDWYIISSAIDNFALKVPLSILKLLRPPAYVAILRRVV